MTEIGVYTITCKHTGLMYVGGTTKGFSKRWNDHKSQLRTGIHPNKRLLEAWVKYGEDNLVFEVLEEVIDKVHVTSTEQYWLNMLDTYANGFNMQPSAYNSKGTKRTEAQKVANGELGNWKKANSKWKGSKHTEETRAIIKSKRKYQIMPEVSVETRLKLSIANTGKPGTYGNRKYTNIVMTKKNELLIFKTTSEAKEHFNLCNVSPITRVIKGIRKSFKGYTITATDESPE